MSLAGRWVTRGGWVFDGFRATKSVGHSNRMVSVYVEAGDVRSAREVFDVMAARDVVSWNAMYVAAAKELFAAIYILVYVARPAREIKFVCQTLNCT